jgi:hypothetical protein
MQSIGQTGCEQLSAHAWSGMDAHGRMVGEQKICFALQDFRDG